MTFSAFEARDPRSFFPVARWALVAACAAALAGCASPPVRYGTSETGGRYFDPQLGVWASPRVIADGEAVPRGGGGYLVGRPYVIAGRTYYPNERPQGYSAVGTASWYGDAFHGRRTANGEIFDKGSISAAHPTLPLPSYVRVTNLKNDRSMIVRVNDRGPYHGGRVMDVSQRVAESLDFKGQGTAQIRVEYIGRAGLAGSDDQKLMASLRLDGGPAQMEGADVPVEVAGGGYPTPIRPDRPDDGGGLPDAPRIVRATRNRVPAPPVRPFEVGRSDGLPPPPPGGGAQAISIAVTERSPAPNSALGELRSVRPTRHFTATQGLAGEQGGPSRAVQRQDAPRRTDPSRAPPGVDDGSG